MAKKTKQAKKKPGHRTWPTAEIHYAMEGEWIDPPDRIHFFDPDLDLIVKALIDEWDELRALVEKLNIRVEEAESTHFEVFRVYTLEEYIQYLKDETDLFEEEE